MNILGHYLDLAAGEELPVVHTHIAMVDDENGIAEVLIASAVQKVRFDRGSISLRSHAMRPVALRLTQNPAYATAFRQMMSDTFSGPKVLPAVVAIGRDQDYPCAMIPVEALEE